MENSLEKHGISQQSGQVKKGRESQPAGVEVQRFAPRTQVVVGAQDVAPYRPEDDESHGCFDSRDRQRPPGRPSHRVHLRIDLAFICPGVRQPKHLQCEGECVSDLEHGGKRGQFVGGKFLEGSTLPLESFLESHGDFVQFW